MAPENHLQLQIPQGTEAFRMEEAYRHRKIIARLEETMTQWGYLPVETPVFDFYDTYRPLLNRRAHDKIYRLIDREGDLLMLRSDITLFLARQMGLHLKEEDLPVRVAYSDSILRHEDPEDISRNEFYQTGAELIGVGGSEADQEVLLLAGETFRSLDLPETVFHVGSRALFKALCREYPAAPPEELQRTIRIRDRQEFRRLLEGRSDRKSPLEDLFFFIGPPEELETEIPGTPASFHSILRELIDLVRGVAGAEPSQNLRLDLSEIGEQPYYTGMVFSAYTPGLPASSASGGRYDELLGAFGSPHPAAGFSLLLRQLEPLLAERDHLAPPRRKRAEGKTLAERYRNARKNRRPGQALTL